MERKYEHKKIKLSDLILDKNNPRFAELYTGSDKESDIIEYLLYTESAKEIAEAISSAQEFYEDRPLWVIQQGSKYLVKDGNRRCSAIKALQTPNKYELDLPRLEMEELPVLVYNNIIDLDARIRLEHNSGLFKKWGRIAKAIEIYRLFSSGNSLESLLDIDSQPKDFIKIATFYYKAVEIQGESFKKLVREGKGEKGGKTIIFERLFKERNNCGYSFKNTGELVVKDDVTFASYINAIVNFLIKKPETSSRTIDQIYKEGGNFLETLQQYGFQSNPQVEVGIQNDNLQENIQTQSINSTHDNHINTEQTNLNEQPNNIVPNTNSIETNNSHTNVVTPPSTNNQGGTRHSIKNKPTLTRKKIPAPLKNLIDECYNLDQNNFANSKTALTRVTFECVLKYVVENSKKSNGNMLSTSNHFNAAFKDKSGNRLPYTNFTILKSKFTELITDTGIRKAFEVLDLEVPHQIIHNYRVGAIPKQAKDLCDNLIDLIEFMLQEEVNLINSLDISKL